MVTRLIRLTCETGEVTSGFMLPPFLLSKHDTTIDGCDRVRRNQAFQWQFSSSIAQLSMYVVVPSLIHCSRRPDLYDVTLTRCRNCGCGRCDACLIVSRDKAHLEPASTVLFDENKLCIHPSVQCLYNIDMTGTQRN